jgi:hypothetical protein
MALDALRDQGFGEADGEVTVALLPSLVEVKLVPLPPLRPEEAEPVVRRDMARHFLQGSAPSVVGVDVRRDESRPTEFGEDAAGEEATERDGGGSPRAARGTVLAAAAPRQLAEAILRAVTGAGWRLRGIVPAHAAWVHAVRSGGEGKSPGKAAPGVIVALLDGTAHLLRIKNDHLTAIRRLPSADLPEVVAAAGIGPGRAWIFADEPAGRGVSEALSTAGWRPAVETRLRRSAAGAAALYAPESGVELVPPTLAMARRDHTRRIAIGMGAVAAFFLVAAAAVQLWGASRELRLVRAERTEIRDAVAPVLVAADSLASIEERLPVPSRPAGCG